MPGNNKIVVNAERTTIVAMETFDTFLKWEYENRQVLAEIPDIRSSADYIQAHGQMWLTTARTLTKAYKQNHSDENLANLDSILAVLAAAVHEAQKYLLNPATP